MRGWQCDDPEQCEHQEEGEADRAAFAIADDVLGVSDLQELGRICLDLLAMAVALSAACVRLWSLFAREERSGGDVHVGDDELAELAGAGEFSYVSWRPWAPRAFT